MSDSPASAPTHTETEQALAALRQSIAAFNCGDREGFLAVYDDCAKLHFLAPNSPQGKQGVRLYTALLENAFPDAEFRVEEIAVQGEMVAMRYRLVGTHLGNFLGKPPTNRSFEVEGYTIMYFKGAKIVEQWSLLDEMSLHRQLGLIQLQGAPRAN